MTGGVAGAKAQTRQVAKGLARDIISLCEAIRGFQPRRWPVGPQVGQAFTVYAIYRQRNAATLEPLLSGASAAHLWALDSTADTLESYTRGTGPGPKFDLLNYLLSEYPPVSASYVVFADDDVEMVQGDLAMFVALQHLLGFDLAQPAHTARSNASHFLTNVRPWLVARQTTFVEIGPLFVVAPGTQGLLPFPANAGMGWGLQALWSTADNLRLGIIDAVTMNHLGRVAAEYDTAPEVEAVRKSLERVGVRDLSDLKRTSRRYWRVPKTAVSHR